MPECFPEHLREEPGGGSGRTGKFFGIFEGGFGREPEEFQGRLCDAASGFDPPDKIKQGDGG